MSKIGRNDPCPCGSGKKYKHCCLRRDEAAREGTGEWSDPEERSIAKDRPARILRLRVVLDSLGGEEPPEPVSRTIEIDDDETLFDLHRAIGRAFGWDNDHFYAFYMDNRLFKPEHEYGGDPMGGDLEDSGFGAPRSGVEAVLGEFRLRRGKHFKYRFDFGAELIHTVEVLDSNAPRIEGAEHPRVVDSVGGAPPQYPVCDE